MYQSVHKNNHLYNCLNVHTSWKKYVDPAKIVSAKLTLNGKKQDQIGSEMFLSSQVLTQQIFYND